MESIMSDELEDIPPLPSEDAIQAFVYHKRQQLIQAVLVKGIPDDDDSRKILLATLKDMDHAALSRQKIAADSQTNHQTAQAAAVIAKLLTQVPNNSKQAITVSQEFEVPTLGADLAAPKLLEGETATHIPQQSYKAFMQKFSSDEEAS
jgi:hypothetical protein